MRSPTHSMGMTLVLAAIVGLSGAVTHSQPALTPRDYDDFYERVILKAGNRDKAEWLASYDPVVSFIARVRQDVEALPEATQRALASAVHDNGYWKGQARRILDPADPFVGARFKADDAALQKLLTPGGFEAYRNRYARGAGGYRLALEVVADRVSLYELEGKRVPRLADLRASTVILNGNAQSWTDLVADAQRFPDPGERLAVIMRNQLNAIASALVLFRGSRRLSEDEMDYATAVIWRYTGHYSGKDAWEREPLVRIPFPELPEAEKVKDRPIRMAVREALAAHPL